MKRHISASVLVLLLFSSCSLSPGEQGRTYYETLNLKTPEEAVETFVDAFGRSDFMTVYLVLAREAQRMWYAKFQLMRYEELFRCDGASCGEIMDELREEVFPEGFFDGEHHPDAWYVFDQYMVAAKAQDALLIDLSGEVKMIDSGDSETHQGEDAVDVIAAVEGIAEQVTFRMIQAPSGRWRVFQVILAGGDEEMLPWAVVKGD